MGIPRTRLPCVVSFILINLLAAPIFAGEPQVPGSPSGSSPPGEKHASTEAADETTPPPEKKPFLRWMDNSLTVLPYGWGYEVDPSEQSALTLEHADETAIGDLFAFMDVNFFHHTSGQEVNAYGEISPRLSVGKILQKDLSFAPFRRSLFEFKDVLFALTYEWGKGPDIPPEAILLGLGFDLDIREAGLLGVLGKFQYVQLNIYARNELADGVDHGFRDAQVSLVCSRPFTIGPVRFLADGYFDWVLGIASEVWSYHLNPQVKLDVGNFWGQPQKLYAGVELDFWWNKFQIPNTAVFDTNQQAVSLLLKYHF